MNCTTISFTQIQKVTKIKYNLGENFHESVKCKSATFFYSLL